MAENNGYVEFRLDSEKIYFAKQAIVMAFTDIFEENILKIDKLRSFLFSGQYEKNINECGPLTSLLSDAGFDHSEIEWIQGCFCIYLSVIQENGKQNWLLENLNNNIHHSSLLRRLLLGIEPQDNPKCPESYSWSNCDVCRVICPLIQPLEEQLLLF